LHKLQTAKNSQLVKFFVILDYDGRKFYIGSFKGTAYQMGLAYGQLFKE
jgi:hypothetical protein